MKVELTYDNKIVHLQFNGEGAYVFAKSETGIKLPINYQEYAKIGAMLLYLSAAHINEIDTEKNFRSLERLAEIAYSHAFKDISESELELTNG